ncbi:MAG: TetR family transcriptional regulator [Candidatus Izemoplasmatales bacterium]
MKNTPIDRSYFLQNNPRLLEETLGEFSSKGYEAASLNEILKRSAFNKGSFYYRFSEKMDLFIALLETLFARHAEELAADRATILEKESVRITLKLMISTMHRLWERDRRYLDLYARIDDERIADRSEIVHIIDRSPIEAFVVESTVTLDALGENPERTALFANLARMVLYRIDEVGRNDRGWIDPAVLADAVMNAAFVDLKTDHRPCDRETARIVADSDDHRPTMEIEYFKGEILAIFGPLDLARTLTRRIPAGRRRPDSLASLGAWLFARETDPEENSRVPLREERTLRWNLKRVGERPVNGEDDLVDELGLADVGDIRIDRLPDAMRRFVRTAATIASGSDPLVVEEPFEGIGDPERKRICQMLLKRRGNGITIILYGTDFESLMGVADRIAFIGRSGTVKTVPAAELNARYGDRVIVVGYRDRGFSRQARFPAAMVGGSDFATFLKGKDVESLETRTMSGAEIYRIETGEDLS